MKTNRLFNLFVVVALVVIAALTVREAAATVDLLSRSDANARSAPECSDLPSRRSIHTKYVEGAGWMTYSEDGPTGVDGGLIHLLTAYRECSE